MEDNFLCLPVSGVTCVYLPSICAVVDWVIFPPMRRCLLPSDVTALCGDETKEDICDLVYIVPANQNKHFK